MGIPCLWCTTDTLTEQDLLKCLHHFAANYYSEKGQLIDSTRIARQKKRAKKKAKSADPGSRSSSQSTMDSISGEGSDDGDTETSSTPSVTSQTSKQKGRQGADLVKDMYKMLDGSALVALGRISLMNLTLVTHCGVQGFLSTSISNGLFRGTGFRVLKRIPNRRIWLW